MTDGGYTLDEVKAMRRANALRRPMIAVDEDLDELMLSLTDGWQHDRNLRHAGWLRAIADGWGSTLLWVTGLEGIGEFGA